MVNILIHRVNMHAYLIYRSLDNPPSLPAFTPTHRYDSGPVAQLTSAMTQIARAKTPSSQPSVLTTSTASGGISPAKMANLRSNYLQQIKDLHMLFENGAMSEAEFMEQKVPILQQLK